MDTAQTSLDQNVSPSPPAPPANISNSQLPKILLRFFTYIAVFLLGVFSFWIYQEITAEETKVSPPPTVTPTPILSPTPTTEATTTIPADWKTYKNKEYGFEINYPTEAIFDKENHGLRLEGEEILENINIWFMGETQKEATELYDGYSINIQVVTNKQNRNTKKIADFYMEKAKEGVNEIGGDINDCSIKSVEVSNKQGYLFKPCVGYYSKNDKTFILSKDNYIILLNSYIPNEEYLKNVQSILSTFKFLD